MASAYRLEHAWTGRADKDQSQQAPAIREDCEQNECKEPAKHFKHCADKVRGADILRPNCSELTNAGRGWQGLAGRGLR